MTKKWLVPLGILAIILVAVPALALPPGGRANGSGDVPAGREGDPGYASGPIRSDEGIDPDECNRVHNITACTGATPVFSDVPPPGPGEKGDPRQGNTGRSVDASVPPKQGMVQDLAPIENVTVRVMESFPPQYAVYVTFGLPSGCVQPGGYQVKREGNQIRLSVWVLKPADPRTICTMIYGIATYDVPLGGDFSAGETYTLDTNGTHTTFTAGR